MTPARTGRAFSRDEVRAQLAARLRLLRGFTDIPPALPGAGRPVGPSTGSPTGPPAESLAAIRRDLGDCTRCRLAEGRQTIVFGVGPENAEILFIGEAPGAAEDRKGEPFVGRAGRLLDEMIEKCFGRRREQVYIANIVKCRPPGNRDPRPDETAACRPFLERQIASIRPGVICLLGSVAVRTLFPEVRGIRAARGALREFAGVPVVATYHPAYLLRAAGKQRGELQREVAADARAALAVVDRRRPGRSRTAR